MPRADGEVDRKEMFLGLGLAALLLLPASATWVRRPTRPAPALISIPGRPGPIPDRIGSGTARQPSTTRAEVDQFLAQLARTEAHLRRWGADLGPNLDRQHALGRLLDASKRPGPRS